MRGSVRWSAWVLTGLMVFSVVAACSKDDTPKMTNDEAVAVLEQQGYTEQSAQCLIDGATHQNVDIFAFLASDKATKDDIAVLTTVGAFCVEHFGSTGTSVPSTAGGTTPLPPG